MALTVLALSGTRLPGQIAPPAPAQEQVVEVRVQGNRAVPARKIGSELRTRAGRPFDMATVEEDVRRLTRTGLFVEVKPYTQSVPGGRLVVFEVLERPTIQYVKFVGNEIMRDKYLRKQLDMKEGDALDLMAVQEGARKLEDFYEEKGYSRVRVTVVEGAKPTDRGVVYLINEGRKEKVSWTYFVGNTIASDARLRTVVQAKQGFLWFIKGQLSRSTVEEDKDRLKAYYRGLGYFDARVEPDVIPNDERTWSVIKWVIDEGPRYKVRSVSVLGNSVYSSEELLAHSELQAGEFFHQGEQVVDRATIADMYGCVGYAFCSVKPEIRFSEQPGEVDLVYSIEEGDRYRVGRINVEITGDNPHTQIATVLDRMSIRPGDIFDVREVRASERRLKASGLFLNDPTKGAVPSIVFSPPEMGDDETQMAGNRSPARGQSPDGAAPRTAYRPTTEPATRTVDLCVHGQLLPQQAGVGIEASGPPQSVGVTVPLPLPLGRPAVPAVVVPPAAPQATGPTGNAPTPTPQRAPMPGTSTYFRPMPGQAVREMQSRATYPAAPAPSVYAHSLPAARVPGLPPAWQKAAAAAPPSVYSRPTPGPPLKEMQLRWRNPPAAGPGQPSAPSASAGTAPAIPPAWSHSRPAASSVGQSSAAYRMPPQPASTTTFPRVGEPIVRGQNFGSDSGYAVPSLPPSQTLGGTLPPATPGMTYPQTSVPGAPAGSSAYGTQPPLPPGSTTAGSTLPYGVPTPPVQQQPYPAYGNPNYAAPQVPDFAPAVPGMPPGDGNILAPPTSPFDAAAADEEYRPLDFTIRTRETETGRLMLGVGVNSDAGLTGQIMLEEQNFDIARWPTGWEDLRTFSAFRGAGQRLRIEAVPGTEVQRYMVSFTEPYLLHTPVSLGLSGYYYDRRYLEWDESRVGGRVSLGYQLTPDLSTSVAFRGMSIEVFNPALPTPPEIAEVVGTNSLLGFGFTVTHDTRDSTFFATEGHLIEFNAEQVTGSFTYPRLDLDVRKYILLHERPDNSGRHVLQLSTQVGWTGDDTPVYEHHFIGGFSTIRGFDFRGASTRSLGYVVGGEFKLLASAQYVFPITADDTLRGVVFCDSGTTQPQFDNWTDDYRVAVGAGLRITIPAMGPAPIALDFAVPVVHNPGDDIENFAFFVGINH